MAEKDKSLNGRIDERMLQVIVNIQKPDGSNGTGFIVSKNDEIFLVTNKHMIGTWSLIEAFVSLPFVTVIFYPSNQLEYVSQKILLKNDEGALLSDVRCHPNEDVDIVAIRITDVYAKNPKISNNHIGHGVLVPIGEISKETYLGYGAQVFAIGYPRGLKLASSNFPIAKSAHIASPLSGDLEIMTDFRRDRQIIPKKLATKFYLLDGLIVGGNSGGPVINPIDFYFSVNSSQSLNVTQSASNLVIGIVSFGWEAMGVTVVYPCDYILELLDPI